MQADKERKIINDFTQDEYKYGFSSDIETETLTPGLNEDVVRFIGQKRNEPGWLIDWRLDAYRKWQRMTEPRWAAVYYAPIDYQKICYYAAPKKVSHDSLTDVDPKLIEAFEKLGISIEEQKRLTGVAVDAVMDSVSVATTFQDTLQKNGIIFLPLRKAIEKYPDLVKKYLGSVVPQNDNFFAALNAAVFSDGSFCYIPTGVRCPLELSTYFRLNTAGAGQFERTLIVAEDNCYVSYLEGCTAPQRTENQLHAAVVEIVAKSKSEVRYATVQNWYPGNAKGEGGIYNFVTKRGIAHESAKVSWTQVEVGAAITWKYPSVILQGDNSTGEFYSMAVTKNKQQADTGSKMIHLGNNTKSTVVSKGIAVGQSNNTYRGLIKATPKANKIRSMSQCDSLIIGNQAMANTFPNIILNNGTGITEHEASISKLNEAQLLYCQTRGLTVEEAAGLVVTGFCKNVLERLPVEFAVEARNLLSLTLEDAIA
jgi:Fe-S cluster assembly protein SufB